MASFIDNYRLIRDNGYEVNPWQVIPGNKKLDPTLPRQQEEDRINSEKSVLERIIESIFAGTGMDITGVNAAMSPIAATKAAGETIKDINNKIKYNEATGQDFIDILRDFVRATDMTFPARELGRRAANNIRYVVTGKQPEETRL